MRLKVRAATSPIQMLAYLDQHSFEFYSIERDGKLVGVLRFSNGKEVEGEDLMDCTKRAMKERP